MADTAILAKLAIVMIVFLMAGKTAGRRTLENIVDMAFFTHSGGVNTGQLECRQVVIKRGGFPGCA